MNFCGIKDCFRTKCSFGTCVFLISALWSEILLKESMDPFMCSKMTLEMETVFGHPHEKDRNLIQNYIKLANASFRRHFCLVTKTTKPNIII